MTNDAWEEPKLRCEIDVRRPKREDCPEEEETDKTSRTDEIQMCEDLERSITSFIRQCEDLKDRRSASAWVDQTLYRADRLREEIEVLGNRLKERPVEGTIETHVLAARDLIDLLDRSTDGKRHGRSGRVPGSEDLKREIAGMRKELASLKDRIFSSP